MLIEKMKNQSTNTLFGLKMFNDWLYFETDKGIVIEDYCGVNRHIVLPEKILGKPVVDISANAFGDFCSILSIEVPKSLVKLLKYSVHHISKDIMIAT